MSLVWIVLSFASILSFAFLAYSTDEVCSDGGVIFVLLIIYNINQIMKLFRGYNIAGGNSRDVSNTQASVYDFGSHSWVKGGDGK